MTSGIHALPARVADCLKVCYHLRERGERITTNVVRELLQAKHPTGRLSGSTITHLFQSLSSYGYAHHTPYHGVELTEAGELAAAELVRHHRLLELFLVRIMGFPLDQVDTEAEQLEYALTETFEDRMDELLGYPTEDPHGDPIPSKMGTVHIPPTKLLSHLEAGQQGIVHRVTDDDPELLRYLTTLGLIPGTWVRVESITPYGDVYTLMIGESNRMVGKAIVNHILIRSAPQDATNTNLSFEE